MLNERETEVIARLASGHSAVDIAAGLFISVSKAYALAESAQGKLGAKTIPHAVAKAYEFGILNIEPIIETGPKLPCDVVRITIKKGEDANA
jgi:DNA-binding CsgD family transcriptional regulator